jgi:hypothetical protein
VLVALLMASVSSMGLVPILPAVAAADTPSLAFELASNRCGTVSHPTGAGT